MIRYYAHNGSGFTDSTLFVVADITNNTEQFIHKDGSKSKVYTFTTNTFAEKMCSEGRWKRVTRKYVRAKVKHLKAVNQSPSV